ncbi:MAG: hypothetical protein NC121_20420 [Blautia sp.]|nr:hypothetical protein [Blautia sp.]
MAKQAKKRLTKPLEGEIEEMCNLSEFIYMDGEKTGKKEEKIRTVYRMYSKGKSVPDIMDAAGTDRSFVDAVLRMANGNLSTADNNIDRVYNAMYAQ